MDPSALFSKWRAPLRDTATYTARTLKLVLASSPELLSILAVLTLFGALTPLGVAYAGKRIVDAVVEGSTASTLRWVLFELCLVALLAGVQRGLALVRSILGGRLGTDVNLRILEQALRLDLAFFEDAEFYDKLTRARREASSRPVALVAEGFQLVQSLITVLGYAAVLVSFNGWVVVGLLAATIPATLAEMRYSRIAFRLRNWRSPESRRLLYLEYVLANDEHAKEVKVFGIGPLLLGRYRTLAETFYQEDKRLALRRAGLTHALSLIATMTFYAAYAVLAVSAARGRLSLGNLTLYLVSLRQGQQAFQSVLGGIGNLYEHNLYMSNLFQYLALAPGNSAKAAVVPRAETGSGLSAEGPKGIGFENLSFRYPGKDSWVLREINLFIPAGQSLALVGDNGAGKTTLVKLLAGLYEPTEGRIILDGRDLIHWSKDALRARLGIVFQDYNQYQLRVRENVGFGSVDHLTDEPRIQRAVERGGASEVVAGLPGGLDAPLGHWFENGSELSGGQWQKLALARAFMREEADILVLDEPTASLDASSEHAVFERFRSLAKGRTTIIISHRFPTVRMAQRIVVLEHGTVIEQGTHDALVAQGGKYARMFALQAAGYR